MVFSLSSKILPERSLGRLALISTLVSAAMIAGSLTSSVPQARATDEDGVDTTTAQDVADALENVDGRLLQDAARSTLAPGDPTEASSPQGVDVEIPADPSDGVKLSAGDFALKIGLPYSENAADSAVLENGGVAYPSPTSSTNAVVPTDGGAQLLSIIETRDAPETYAYELSTSPGHRLEATPDGGAQIVDDQGVAKAIFEPAWAQDANGTSIPTHYSVEGNMLIQVVEHNDRSDISYPIVADPFPVIVIVITAAAAIVVAAAALGVATWLVVSWWNTCRAQGKYPELSTRNGFTARCVR